MTQLGFQQIWTNWNAGPNPKDDGKSGLDTRGGSGGGEQGREGPGNGHRLLKRQKFGLEIGGGSRWALRCLSRGDERAWLSCFRGFKLEAGEQGPGQQIPGCRREVCLTL